jgi:ATP-dependent helicase HrpA
LHRQWAFGELHESTTIERNRLSLVAYPAIQDRGNGVCFIEARSAAEAEAISREGIMRLATLALPQQSKMLRKRIAEDRELILLAQGLTLERPLPDALTDRAFRECFVPEDAPLPRTREAFEKVLDTQRAAVSDVADSLTALVTTSLREWRAVRAALEQLASPVFQETVADVQSQLAALMPPDLLRSTPRKWLNEIPRYLKAVSRRVERARGNVSRDIELSRKVTPFESALRALASQPAPSAAIPAFEQLRWMIEELRVSLFAQELRTIVPVSEKRLADQLARARAAARM